MSGSQMAKAKEDAGAIMRAKQAAGRSRPNFRLQTSTHHIAAEERKAKEAAEKAAAGKK